MKILSTILILLLSGFSFSQFHRSFLQGSHYVGPTAFGSYAYYNDQNKVQLATLGSTTSSEVGFIMQQVSAQGDLESIDRFEYPINLMGVTASYCLLLTVIEQGNERYFVLALEGSGATYQKLIWLKTNKTNGNFIASVTSPNNYKIGYFEPKIVGNELVSYGVKSVAGNEAGLVRIALNIGTFSAPLEEMVDTAATSSMVQQRLMTGYKSGHLFVMNGLEKVVWGVGNSSGLGTNSTDIYTRTAPTSYSTFHTGVPSWGSVSAFLIDTATLAITNGTTIEHYNASGTLTTSGNFPWQPAFYGSQVEFMNNQYHLIYKHNTFLNTGMFYTADQNFHYTDSVPSMQKYIYHLHKNANGLLMVGSDVKGGLSLEVDGSQNVAGRIPYCESYKTMPFVDRDEYGTSLKSGHYRATIGLGTKVIVSPYNRSEAQYDNLTAVYSLDEHFVGFMGSDTISNATSAYSYQYHELPGPNTTSNLYDEILEAKYNRPYRVSLQMIQDHIDSVAFGSASYIPAWAIRHWPAHGDPALGQEETLAPFADINSNGIYEPLSGDYPRIYGNDCVFSITHYRTNGDDSKALEFHSYVYTQACDSTETFDNVLMRKIRVYSRGAVVDSLFFGGDFDNGLWNSSNYGGTNVDLGMVYHYMGSLNDPVYSYSAGYEDKLPAHGIMVLKGFRQQSDGLDNGIGIMPGESVNGYGFNDGIIDNEYKGLSASNLDFSGAYSGNWNAESTEGWHNILNGLWSSGDTMYYGGAISHDGTIPTRYRFSGDQDTYHCGTGGIDPGFNWYSHDTLGSGSAATPIGPGGYRSLYSFGKTNLEDDRYFELDYAYLINRRSVSSTSVFDPVVDLFTKASAVRSAFLSNDGPCGINFDPTEENLGLEESTLEGEDLFTVYPNPTTGFVRVNGVSEAGGTIQVFDINGKLLQSVSDYQAMQVLDLSQLQGNLFILQISSESKTEQKRVVKY